MGLFRSTMPADERVLTWIKGRGVSSGADIADGLGMWSGTLYPALRRLELRGEIVGRWESDGPFVTAVSRRRLYHVPFRKVLANGNAAMAQFYGRGRHAG